MRQKIRIDYYSDVLCIWAYIAQARMQQLRQEFADQVEIRWRYLSVFGDVPGKMSTSWAERGGAAGYARHVQQLAADFPEIETHPELWRHCCPQSSGPAHLWLCAARLQGSDQEALLAHAFREGFFRNLQDIACNAQLHDIAAQTGLDTHALQAKIDDGSAWASLCADWNLAREAQVQASPTLIFNEGRQRLTGNVGYRIIKANLTELMDRPDVQHSWC